MTDDNRKSSFPPWRQEVDARPRVERRKVADGGERGADGNGAKVVDGNAGQRDRTGRGRERFEKEEKGGAEFGWKKCLV